MALHPSRYVGRSGESMSYLRKEASSHSCDPSFVPFTVEGCTVNQAPVFVYRRIQRAHCTRAPYIVAASVSSARFWPRRRTAVRPSRRQAEWSTVRNSTWPLSAATRCPVMTQDAIQFSWAVWDGSGRENPACLTGRWVTPVGTKLGGRPRTLHGLDPSLVPEPRTRITVT